MRNKMVVMKDYLYIYILREYTYEWGVYCDLQKCTDVLDTAPDTCSEMCLTASDDGSTVIKVEEGSYVLEEEDPLALTVPATKAEEEVSYVQLTVFVARYGLCLRKFSLPHSQAPGTCHYHEPARSSPCPTSYFLKIHLNIILPSTWNFK